MKFLKNTALGIILATLFSCAQTPAEMPVLEFISFPDSKHTSLPYLFAGSDGPIISWVKMLDDSTAQLRYTRLEEEVWQEPKPIVQGKDWFLNWADFPAITENNGNLLTHILQRSSGGKYSYDVKLNLLERDNLEWKTSLPLHTDSTFTEHGFVSAVPYGTESFFVTWLDGRNTGEPAGHDHSSHGGAMSIRAATVSLYGSITDEVMLDARTCDCCQTSTAMTEKGPIIVYRDRSASEVRDIAITRFANSSWTSPQLVHSDNWEINGCPVNGPKVDAEGKTVVVAWFTGVNDEPKVNIAFSSDSGETFSKPIHVGGEFVLGRVDVALLDDHSAVLTWMETENEVTYLKAAKVTDSGLTKSMVITEMNAARKSGFPQLEVSGEKIYLAWTEISEEITQVKSASMARNAFE